METLSLEDVPHGSGIASQPPRRLDELALFRRAMSASSWSVWTSGIDPTVREHVERT